MRFTDLFRGRAIVAPAFILLVTATTTFANPPRPFEAGSGFGAPTINGSANVSDPQEGDLIYDTNASAFKGYNGSSWLTFATSTNTAPTVQKFTSTGACSYTTPTSPAPLYIRVRMVGGGGGGGGGGTASGGTGGTGGNSTFGTSLLVADGGNGGGFSAVGGTGGTASLGAGPIGTALTGGQGSSGANAAANSAIGTGHGGSSAFGGAGSAGYGAGAGQAGATNTGGGGGGAGANGTGGLGGAGGGSGGFVDAIIPSPGSSYSCNVGTGGLAGTAGTGGNAGGAGGTGYIIVEEFYQ